MNDLQRRIHEDLRGVVQGPLLFDEIALALYAGDGSLFQRTPLGVFMPRHREDVQTLLRYAAENRISVSPRGAGTGLAGGCVGEGLILDFSRSMRRILEVRAQSVVVQPGVVCERLNAHLAPLGRRIAPDPSGAATTTLGSMAAVDAAGSHSLRHGTTRDHVLRLEAVLAGGETLQARRPNNVAAHHTPATGNGAPAADGFQRQLEAQLTELLARHEPLIRQKQSRAPRDRTGYDLAGACAHGRLDLTRLLVGSEGTLAAFTEIEIATVALPASRAVVLLFFTQLEAATRAVSAVVEQRPSACDLLDRRLLSLARETLSEFENMIPPDAEAALLVEFEGETEAEVRDAAQRLVERMGRVSHTRAHTAFHAHEVERLWQLPRTVMPMLYRMKGPLRPLPFVEDMVVPPDELTSFVQRMQNVLKRHEVTASLYAHAGHGQLHCRPFLNPRDPQDLARLRALADELYEQLWDCGGSVSGEHGEGIARTAFVRRQQGDLYPLLREVKGIFDPQHVLNPGKIISDDPDRVIQPWRPFQPPKLVPLRLNWRETAIDEAAERCNGCGACRTLESGLRMCPIFRAAPSEAATPRAKANVMRHLLDGSIDPAQWQSQELKDLADLCVHCLQCRLECPATVDIPKLMLEAKSAYVAANGLTWHEWAISRIEFWAALASKTSFVSNRLLSNGVARWLLEKALGIDRRRKLPRFAARSFLKRAARRRLTRRQTTSGRRVAYLVDVYANYCDPALAEAMVAVFQHNDVAVYVPPKQRGAGMPLIAAGDVEAAAKLARHNLRILGDLVRDGFTIVCTEPAAAVCLIHEYPALLDDPDAELVAQNTVEACHYLWQMHRQGALRQDFSPIELAGGYHAPCHLKALQRGTPGHDLVRLIPGVRLPTIDQGCSGMAGTFGLRRDNFRTSVHAGWGLISRMRQQDVEAAVTECSACALQIQQGADKPTVHPLKLLAMSYGLLSGILERPRRPRGRASPGKELARSR